MRDLHRLISVGLPVGSFLLCLAVALYDAQVYRVVIAGSEKGYLEHSTVVLLLPAIVLAGWLTWHFRTFPNRLVCVWTGLFALGALYFAGEEASWGQHYFGWKTPESWRFLNDQGETNLHNVSGLFDQVPRGLLSLGAAGSIALAWYLRRRRRAWDASKDWRAWVFPTTAVIPAAALAVAVGLPQKFYGHYGAQDPRIPDWLDRMFLRGYHSELKEHFLAMFLLMYIASWATRYRSFRRSQSERDQTQRVDSAAAPRRSAA